MFTTEQDTLAAGDSSGHRSTVNWRRSARIVVDLTPILPGGDNGGAKVFVFELIREMARLAPRWQFVLLTQGAADEEIAELDSFNVQRRVMIRSSAPGQPARWRAAAARLLPLLPAPLRRFAGRKAFAVKQALRRASPGSFLRGLDADLLFCPFTAPVYAEPGVPVVCTLYDLQYKRYPQFFAPEDVAHRDAVFHAACRSATYIAAISDYARDSALHHGEIDRQRIGTIALRLAKRFDAAGQAHPILARHGLEGGKYLLYPANFWRHKNHEMLLTAFGMAVCDGLPAEFCLVCTGAPGARLEYLRLAVERMGLAGRVRFPGYLDSSEFSHVLSACAGVVFPSLYEGFGLPVLEAMAAGVPVACSNATSLPEVAGDAALLFDPRVASDIAACMVTLATDITVREHLVRAGRERAVEFEDSGRMATEYLSLFDKAMTHARPASTLAGVHDDDWAGSELRLDVVAPGNDAWLDFEFLVPDWIPGRAVRLELRGQQGTGARRSLRVPRGRTGNWSLPVRDGRVNIHLHPCFVPAKAGHGEDARELSLMVRSCRVRRADGTREILWGSSGV